MNKRPGKNHKLFNKRLDLKLILNIWTITTICLFTADFFSGNLYDSSASIVGVIYMSLLGIYASEKELMRWKTQFSSKFIGESFVGVWTALMIIFTLTAPFSGGFFRIPGEFGVVYATVVGVFAITQHSKRLKEKQK